MVVVERLIQQVRPDKWAELEVLDKKYGAVESRHGFPDKKRYRCFVGADNTNTLIIERQWESLAAMETAYEKVFTDSEWQALGIETEPVIESDRHEIYIPLP
jgi:hypothetical protein